MQNEEPEFRRDSALRAFDSLAELPSVSPINGRIMGWYPVIRPERLPALACGLAAESRAWARTPISTRLKVLKQLRTALACASDSLAHTIARETGKPIVEAYGAEIIPTLRQLEWLEQNAERVLAPEPLQRFPRRRYIEHVPYGVVGVISPWNYPLFLSLPTIAAALVAGNAVLWKPSELALASAQTILALFAQTGAKELVRCASGGPDVGAALLTSGCDKYVFIGSTATGRQVLATLGSLLKPAVAELSGVDPMVVCEDADLEIAVRAAIWGRVCNSGQTCMAPRRIFVQCRIYETFLERARRHLRSLRIGDPLDPQTEVGPLRTEQALHEAEVVVDDALRQGARLLCGGKEISGDGYYFEPALLADCDELMEVFQRDLFAPIVAVASFRNDEEAIACANEAAGMLTASVWTRDMPRGREIASRIRAGVVSLNDVVLPGAQPDVPFGGHGRSGYGRMRGAAGLREMIQPRAVDEGPPTQWPRMHLYPYREGTINVLRAVTRWAVSTGLERFTAMREFGAAVARYQRRDRCG